jgi:hypothetical protein
MWARAARQKRVREGIADLGKCRPLMSIRKDTYCALTALARRADRFDLTLLLLGLINNRKVQNATNYDLTRPRHGDRTPL